LLNLKDGDVVADVGCGSGYFALTLSPMVGSPGKVLALDIRRISLFVLWIRAILRDGRNISIIHAEPGNTHLATGTVDAVLVANTYHELTYPETF
jgi:ubiquinone/menaquinone biosynthesis C-methylase UbiE